MKKVILSLVLALVGFNSYANDTPRDPCRDLAVLREVQEVVPKTKYWYDREMMGYEKAMVITGKTLMTYSDNSGVACEFTIIYKGTRAGKAQYKRMTFGGGLRYTLQPNGRVDQFQVVIADRVELYQGKRK
ncbi:hypothetical protein ACMGDI_17185 [Morganella morganii]|uniref:hypothetical protein n=1 Tax=Morganella morganii TaxID=582 RepID=UPI003EBD3D4E